MHVDKIKLNKKERKVMVARIWDGGILEGGRLEDGKGQKYKKYVPIFFPNTFL